MAPLRGTAERRRGRRRRCGRAPDGRSPTGVGSSAIPPGRPNTRTHSPPSSANNTVSIRSRGPFLSPTPPRAFLRVRIGQGLTLILRSKLQMLTLFLRSLSLTIRTAPISPEATGEAMNLRARNGWRRPLCEPVRRVKVHGYRVRIPTSRYAGFPLVGRLWKAPNLSDIRFGGFASRRACGAQQRLARLSTSGVGHGGGRRVRYVQDR